MNKAIDWTAKLLAGAGALNWGLQKLGFDLLTYFGSFSMFAQWAIAVSGGYVLYLLFTKKL